MKVFLALSALFTLLTAVSAQAASVLAANIDGRDQEVTKMEYKINSKFNRVAVQFYIHGSSAGGDAGDADGEIVTAVNGLSFNGKTGQILFRHENVDTVCAKVTKTAIQETGLCSFNVVESSRIIDDGLNQEVKETLDVYFLVK